MKVFLHPGVLRRLRGPDAKLLERIEKNYDVQVNFESSESYHVENFKFVDEVSGKEIR